MNVKGIDFETRELTVRTEKTRLLNSLRIQLPLFKGLVEFAQANSSLIKHANGYILFSDAAKPRAIGLSLILNLTI